MKAEMDARFDGSFRQFIDWMEETFKAPDDMRVRVRIGAFAQELPAPPSPQVFSREALKLASISGVSGAVLTGRQAEEIIGAIFKLTQSNQKINAIKLLREKSGLGLKEAKDFIEALPNKPTFEEEIPF